MIGGSGKDWTIGDDQQDGKEGAKKSKIKKKLTKAIKKKNKTTDH